MNEKIIKKLYDLYVISIKKYLVLNKYGDYSRVEWFGKKHPDNKKGAKPLKVNGIYDFMEDHLLGKKTIGVFSGNYFSKFICFDVDIKDNDLAKMAVYKIVNTLNNQGIDMEYIFISWSGNKGYHIDLFFEKPLSNNIVKKFFYHIMWESDLYIKDTDGKWFIEGGNVELRPLPELGVKIPLGCNFRNGNWMTQECWFCDYCNGLELIKDRNYILTVKKISCDKIYNILNEVSEQKFYESYKKDITKDIQQTEEAILNHRKLKIYEQGIDEEITIEALEKLEFEGLRISGTRHKSLLKLSKYYRYLGLAQKQTEIDLIEWMKRQDKRFYSTTWDKILEDIKDIVKDTYDKRYSLLGAKKNIEVNDCEIREILKIGSLNEKLLIYAMLIHSKRYAINDGIFYMTYEQMEQSTGIDLRTCKRLINKLIEMKVIEAIERNTTQAGTIKKKPNKYKILINVDNSIINKVISIEESNYNSFYVCIKSFLNHKELRLILPRKQFESIRNAI